MIRTLCCFLAICAAFTCTSCASLEGGSSTTGRPALTKPAIEPDGAFWDATTVAKRGDADAFLFLLSPQMVYLALFPEEELPPVESQEEFTKQREQLELKLEPFQKVVDRFAARYMLELQKILRDRFVEVSKPTYTAQFKDSYDRLEGPNRARVTVKIYPKTALPENAEPETMEVRFVQDGRRWLIDGFTNDKLKGAFVR